MRLHYGRQPKFNTGKLVIYPQVSLLLGLILPPLATGADPFKVTNWVMLTAKDGIVPPQAPGQLRLTGQIAPTVNGPWTSVPQPVPLTKV